jgi:hypothetical protein
MDFLINMLNLTDSRYSLGPLFSALFGDEHRVPYNQGIFI